jgi:hypothetical protein
MTARQPGSSDPIERSARRPAVHRDGDGQRVVARDRESLTDRLIREAQERGAFDDLPGRGEPLRIDRNPYAGEMELAHQMLRNASVAPPWIEADKEARALRAQRDHLIEQAGRTSSVMHQQYRRELASIVSAHAAAVGRLNASAPTARQHRSPLRLDEELAALERRFADGPSGSTS